MATLRVPVRRKLDPGVVDLPPNGSRSRSNERSTFGERSRAQHYGAPNTTKVRVLDSQSRVLDFRCRFLGLRAQVFDSKSQVLDSRSQVLDSRSRVLGSRSRVLDSRSRVLDSRSRVLDSRFPDCRNDYAIVMDSILRLPATTLGYFLVKY